MRAHIASIAEFELPKGFVQLPLKHRGWINIGADDFAWWHPRHYQGLQFGAFSLIIFRVLPLSTEVDSISELDILIDRFRPTLWRLPRVHIRHDVPQTVERVRTKWLYRYSEANPILYLPGAATALREDFATIVRDKLVHIHFQSASALTLFGFFVRTKKNVEIIQYLLSEMKESIFTSWRWYNTVP